MNKRLQSIIVRAGHFFARSNWLPAMRMLAAFVILGLPPVSHAEAERESVVITGDSAGASCRRVAVGLVKYQLHHSWFAGMTGWGRGKPKVTDMRAELYVYDRHDRKLSKMLEIEAPRKWREDTQFELTPRILPDGEIIFMLRGGCGNGNQSCRESRHFKLTGPGQYKEIEHWPAASAEESASLRQCTSYRSYENNRHFISIGAGESRQPVLMLQDGALVPCRAGEP